MVEETSCNTAAAAGESAEAAAAAAPGTDAARRSRSRSRSRSKSSRSSSSRSSSSTSAPQAPKFVIDQRVEVFGLESESSKMLNGRVGVVIQYIRDSDRYEVKFGPEQVALLRADKLREPAGSSQRFAVEDHVEVFGLESEGGKALNGQHGIVLSYVDVKERYEVRFGADRVTLVKPSNLRASTAAARAAAAAESAAKAEKPKPMSLASLLCMGRAEEKKAEQKPQQWQSVWERSGSAAPSGSLTADQYDSIMEMQNKEEERKREVETVREKVKAEFAQAGIFDEGMIEAAFTEQLEAHDLQKLLRPKEHAAEQKRRGRSRSGSRSSSSSSSRSRSRSRGRSQEGKPASSAPGTAL